MFGVRPALTRTGWVRTNVDLGEYMTDLDISAELQTPLEEGRRRDGYRSAFYLVILACLLFLPTGILAAMQYRRALQLRKDDPHAAAAALSRCRNWVWHSVTLALTLLVVGLMVAIVIADDFAVIRTFMDPSVLTPNIGYLLQGFWVNVKLFLVAEVLILAWSLLVAILRELPGKSAALLRLMAVIYVDLFRGLPAILVILLIGLGLPRTNLPILSDFNEFQTALMALTLTYGAYMSEVIRAGIHSVHWSQDAAARSLGLSHIQSLRLVVLPQAIRNVIPPLLNGFISLQKETALVSVIGVLDAVNRAAALSSYTANLSPYTGIALAYLMISFPLGRYVEYLERRNRRQRLAKG